MCFVYAQNKGELKIIYQYCEFGDLEAFTRKNRIIDQIVRTDSGYFIDSTITAQQSNQIESETISIHSSSNSLREDPYILSVNKVQAHETEYPTINVNESGYVVNESTTVVAPNSNEYITMHPICAIGVDQGHSTNHGVFCNSSNDESAAIDAETEIINDSEYSRFYLKPFFLNLLIQISFH